jgi:Zinc carboxypeptidase
MQRQFGTRTGKRRKLAFALLLAALTLVGATSAYAVPPWDGTPISQGFGPTYGDPWCNPAAAASEPGVSPQQGPPLALMPYGALACSLEQFQNEAAAAGIPQRMTYSVIGQSAGGRDLYGVVINALETANQRRDFQRWQALRGIELENPAAADALLTAWGNDVKMPIFIEANIHGNEEEGADAMMQAIRDLVTTPLGTNPAVDQILNNAILVVIPVQNPDGRFLGIRQNENRFDMNRDLLVQSQAEMRANIRVQQRWLATNGLALHGYLQPTLIDGLTKPHNPGMEYDIFLYWNQRRLDANEADLTAVPGAPGSTGYGVQRPVNDWCDFADLPENGDPSFAPFCDASGTPPGPAEAEGWDDWGPFYTQTYISLIGIDGSTVEMCSLTALDGGCGGEGRLGSKKAQYVTFYSSARYWLDNKSAMMRDQVEIYSRGVADADRPNCCDDPLISGRGFTEADHNWMVPYPKAYVIPREGGGQRSNAEANRMAKWLLDNGIKVERATAAFTWNGVNYPAGSYVVWMNQALRGLALTTLNVGQDISARISILYAPPGAWSHGHVWGADVVEVPRGATFAPPTAPISEPTPLQGGIRGGPGVPAEWYSATVRGPIELRAILGLLRAGVDAELAEAPFASTTGGPMPAGTLIFPSDAVTAAALHAAGQNAGIWFERNVGVTKPPTSRVMKPPRIAVLVNSATPETSTTTRPIHEVLESIFGSDLVGFVSTVNGANSLQNAASDPLANFDVIYNTGQAYPSAANATARARLNAFFARGGGYIGTSQSGTNFTFVTGAGLVSGAFTHGVDAADGGIAVWDNVGGSASPISGGFPARDTLFIPADMTYFSAIPSGAFVAGRYRDSASNMFLAGLWLDRDVAVPGSPMLVHGTTNVLSRYMGLATDPLSRHDGEREWPLVGQAALWSTLTDEAPVSAVNFPAAGGDYGDASWDTGCPSPGICGTSSSNPGPAVERVQVAIQQLSTGLWWNGTAFASATPVYSNATGTTSWSFAFPATRFPADGDYVVRSKAITVGGNEEVAPTAKQFTFDGTPPTISVRSPAAGGTYSQGQTVNAGYSCADAASGVRSCTGPVENGAPINTSAPGQHLFTVTATDQAGNEASQTVSYTVFALSCRLSIHGRPVATRTRQLTIVVTARNADGTRADPARPLRVTLRGAGVRKTVTAASNGVARVAVRPSRTGTIRVVASASNMDACRGSVRVRPAPRGRAGTAGTATGGGALTGRPH